MMRPRPLTGRGTLEGHDMATALDPHAAIATTASGVAGAPLTTADGKPLARALIRSQRRAKRRAFVA